MALTTRFWGASKVLLITGGLVATYFLFALAGMRVALRAREVVVPDLAALTITEATSELEGLRLALRVEDGRQIHPSILAGRIVEQDPQAGLTTRQERSVKVWLSSGPHAGEVPTVIGESEHGAEQRLAQDALALAAVSEFRSSRYPSGAVVAQDPPPRAAGTQVSVLVNLGERGATYVMPDLIGVAGDSAAEILRTRGFRVTVVGDHPYPGLPAGIVLRQIPPAGFQIAPGQPISLEVSR